MKKFYLMLAAVAALTMNAQDTGLLLTGEVTVGDWETEDLIDGSYCDFAPTNFYLAHTGCQMIYTAGDLADMVRDGAKQDVKVKTITYRFFNEGAFEDITRDVKVYVQPLDAIEFAVVDGKKQFFEFDLDNPQIDEEQTYELYDCYYDDGELVLDFDAAPYAVTPGKGLLVTLVCDAQDDDNCTEGTLCAFYDSGLRSRAMMFTNNNVSFVEYAETEDFPDATAMLGCGTNINLPVTKIAYTYTETPTAVSDVRAESTADAPYYDMMGRQHNAANLPAGIYVHGGQKVIVK